jgi:transposase
VLTILYIFGMMFTTKTKGVRVMPKCKKCDSERAVKNGIVAGKQRYCCQECGCNFREGDNRTNEKIAAKKALCILLYAMAKGSYRMMGRILRTKHTLVYRWIREFGKNLPEPEIPGEIRQMEFDELWHFVGSKKENFGLSKPLTVVQGEPWPGYSVIVILQPSEGFMTK